MENIIGKPGKIFYYTSKLS